MEIEAFGGVGLVFPLPFFAMLGLGIAMSVSYLKQRICPDDTSVTQGGDIEAMIDKLPDDILFNVVSRLRRFEASRTSILSRRWRHIWTMNPKIKFSCLSALDYSDTKPHRDCNAKLRFFKAVNQCLKLYSGRKLKSFRLNCCFLKEHASHFEGCMQSISRLDVEELCLDGTCGSQRHFATRPRFTFSFRLIYGLSTSLRKLSLTDCDVKPYLPSQFRFLEKLDLQHVQLVGNDMSSLLLSCPNLKIWDMHKCILPSKSRIFGRNLKLSFLTFSRCIGIPSLDISAANLVYLEFYGNTKVKLLLSFVPKLERLLVEYVGEDKLSYCFGDDVQRGLPRLKWLLVQIESTQMHWTHTTFMMFSNIRRLYLLMKFEVDLQRFATILSVCPLLEAFHLSKEFAVCNKTRKVHWPTLRHQHLEYMELAGFSRTQNELEFAKFILSSTEALGWLILRRSFRKYYGHDFGFLERDEEHISCYDDGDDEEAQMICQNLQQHALSIHARVKMCCYTHIFPLMNGCIFF